MSSSISLKKNFILNVILTMSTIIFPLITFPYVSRIIGPSGTGKVTFATSIISYFSLFAQLGIPTYGIRICARCRDDKEEFTRTVQELLIINLFMDVLSYLIFFITLYTIPKFIEYRSLLVLMSSTILLTTIGIEWLYRAIEEYNFITISSVIFKCISMVLLFLTVHTADDYLYYGGLSVLSASGSCIINFIYARKYVSFKVVGNYNFGQHLRPIMVFFAMSCATTVYTNLDNVMLGFMAGDEEIGYYNAAVKIKMALVSVVTSLGAVLLPRISYFVSREKHEEARMIVKKAIHFVFFIAIPLTIYFILFAKESIFLLSGTQFSSSILPMQIIMPTVLIIGISNVTGIQMLIPIGKERIVLYSEIAGAIVDLIINAILIPVCGASGAAIGTLIAEIVVLAIQYFYIRKDYPDIFLKINIKSIMLASLISSLTCIWVKLMKINNFSILLLSSIIYFMIYLFIMFMKNDDIAKEVVSIIKKIMKVD